MDSVKVLLETLNANETTSFSSVLNFLSTVAPWLIALLVPIFTLRFTRKIKELELADADRARMFQLQRTVTEKSLEVMREACYRLQRMLTNVAILESGNTSEELRKRALDEAIDSRDYIDLWRAYFPDSVSDSIRTTTYQLSNVVNNRERLKRGFVLDIFTDAVPKVKAAISEMDELVKDYNLLNANR